MPVCSLGNKWPFSGKFFPFWERPDAIRCPADDYSLQAVWAVVLEGAAAVGGCKADNLHLRAPMSSWTSQGDTTHRTGGRWGHFEGIWSDAPLLGL